MRTLIAAIASMILAISAIDTAAQTAPAGDSVYAGDLMTRWGKDVTPDNAWRSYPRPQLKRERWLNLNGLWDYAIARDSAPQPAQGAARTARRRPGPTAPLCGGAVCRMARAEWTRPGTPTCSRFCRRACSRNRREAMTRLVPRSRPAPGTSSNRAVQPTGIAASRSTSVLAVSRTLSLARSLFISRVAGSHRLRRDPSLRLRCPGPSARAASS